MKTAFILAISNILSLIFFTFLSSESATESPKQAQPRDKCGRFEKSKRADDPRK